MIQTKKSMIHTSKYETKVAKRYLSRILYEMLLIVDT